MEAAGGNMAAAEDHGSCVVCQDALLGGDDVTTQLECGHEFHTQCILGWFRSLQARCPLCLRTGGAYVVAEDDEDEDYDLAERANWQEIVRFAATPDAPPWLASKLRTLQAVRAKLAEKNRQLAALRRQAVPAGMTYAEAHTRLRAEQRRAFACRRRVWMIERLVRRRVRVSTVVITRQRAAPTRRSSRLGASGH